MEAASLKLAVRKRCVARHTASMPAAHEVHALEVDCRHFECFSVLIDARTLAVCFDH